MRWLAALAFASAAFAAEPREPRAASVTPWPEADALFHQDPRWLGSDCAYSVDLGGGHVLWLFGDTYIATSAAHKRRESKMPRNTIAVQQGYDPSKAEIQFYWNTRNGAPASFFPDADWGWYWPGGGVRLDDQLLLFFMKVRRTGDGMFGFASFGWAAVAIDNPDASPDRWHLRWLDSPPNKFNVLVGSGSVLRVGDYVHALGVAEPAKDHALFIARWPVAAARRGDLSSPEWWEPASARWIAQRDLKQRPAPVFANAQTEFTVHHDSRLNGYIEVQTRGFGGADLAWRSAPAITGPWSALQSFHRPAESALPRVLVYAGKAHPELTGADLVVTYATNAEWARVLDDMKLYYPRFLKVTLAR
jgi:hypothetical protein